MVRDGFTGLSRSPEFSLRQFEIHRNACLEIGGVAIVRIRFVAPLLHRIGSRLGQQSISGNQLQGIHFALLVDDGLQNDSTLNFAGAGLLRVVRMNPVHHLVVGVIFRNFQQIAA